MHSTDRRTRWIPLVAAVSLAVLGGGVAPASAEVPLIEAVKAGDTARLRELLGHQVDVNASGTHFRICQTGIGFMEYRRERRKLYDRGFSIGIHWSEAYQPCRVAAFRCGVCKTGRPQCSPAGFTGPDG